MSITTAAIVYMDKSFVYIMNGNISFTGAIQLQYGIKFMKARVKNILNDIVPSYYLLARSKSSYMRYVMLARILSKNGEVLPTPGS